MKSSFHRVGSLLLVSALASLAILSSPAYGAGGGNYTANIKTDKEYKCIQWQLSDGIVNAVLFATEEDGESLSFNGKAGDGIAIVVTDMNAIQTSGNDSFCEGLVVAQGSGRTPASGNGSFDVTLGCVMCAADTSAVRRTAASSVIRTPTASHG